MIIENNAYCLRDTEHYNYYLKNINDYSMKITGEKQNNDTDFLIKADNI